jgi:serine/threonine protein kinase
MNEWKVLSNIHHKTCIVTLYTKFHKKNEVGCEVKRSDGRWVRRMMYVLSTYVPDFNFFLYLYMHTSRLSTKLPILICKILIKFLMLLNIFAGRINTNKNNKRKLLILALHYG